MVDWPEILKLHGPVVWRTIYRLLGQEADALDCYQETFLTAYRIAGRQPIINWPSFLVSLATRRAIDHLRRKGRSRRRFASLHGVPEPVSETNSPEEYAQGVDLLNRIRELLAGLPKIQAEVFWLRCVEEMSHREIGEHLSITEGNVRVQLLRARKRLQSALRLQLPDLRAKS